MKKQILNRFAFVVGIALFAAVIATPPQYFAKVLGEENSFVQKLKELKITLGLDLAGGTELDYKIDLNDAIAQNSDDDPLNDVNLNIISESVRDALEMRINPAGVGEVSVKRSQIDGKEHVLVQLPPSSNVDKAKKDAEKDNRLEFFEEDPDLAKKARIKIAGHLTVVTSQNWEEKVEELEKEEHVSHEKVDFRYKDQVRDSDFAEKLFSGNEGDIIEEIIETQTEVTYKIDAEGNMQIDSFPKLVDAIIRISEKRDQEREKPVPEKAHARHILFGFPGAMRALSLGDYETVEEALAESQKIIDNPESIPEEEREEKVKSAEKLIKKIEEFPYKSQIEAKAKAEEIFEKLMLEGTESFSDLAKKYSTEPKAKTSGGDLGEFEPGKMVMPFSNAVFTFAKKTGKYEEESEVETSPEEDVITEEDSSEIQEETSSEVDGKESEVEEIEEDPFEPQLGLVPEIVETDFGYHVIEVLGYKETETEKKAEPQVSYEMIAWDKNALGWKKTKLGGAHLENATVGYDQVGQPLVNLLFNAEGGDLFAELTGTVAAKSGECDGGTCRLGIKVGGNWITTPTVREKIFGRQSQITGNFTYDSAHQLAADLNLGAIDAPVILSGQTTIKAELGQDQLTKSLKAGFWGFVATMFFMILGYRFAGVIASIALSIYAAIFITILKTWPESFGGPIVLTLAGMAGIALSIGLAVDGNILIFERMKEEFAKRKNMNQAVDLGFKRAWTAIRDSNLTTLLTCIILFSMGSSIIKGFAITLIVGTLLSMFTAVTISRNLLRFFLLFDCFHKPWLFGISKSYVTKIEKSSKMKIRARGK